MHLVAQPPFGADAAAAADQHHADHQLGVDRGPTNGAVVGRKLAPDAAQFNEAVDGAQQVVGRDQLLQAVPQNNAFYRTCRSPIIAVAPATRKLNQDWSPHLNGLFQRNRWKPDLESNLVTHMLSLLGETAVCGPSLLVIGIRDPIDPKPLLSAS